MEYVIGFIIGAVIGFVGGFLVFRNNQKKINALEIEGKDAVNKIKTVVDEIKK